MRRNVLTITAASNPADQSCGTIDGEVLPPEMSPAQDTQNMNKAINFVHAEGVRSGRPELCALAIKASLECRALKSHAQLNAHRDTTRF